MPVSFFAVAEVVTTSIVPKLNSVLLSVKGTSARPPQILQNM